MQEYTHLLAKNPLFAGIAPNNLKALLQCVGANSKVYAKDEFISLSGDNIEAIGVVLAGQVRILKEDVFGNQAILNTLPAGAIFGESFICGGAFSLTVSIQAVQASTILFLSFNRVMQACSNACQFHNTLIKNMVTILAQKNIALMEKLEITTKHSLREKILSYLSQLVQQQGGNVVTSPLGRTDLANFFGANRSALTRELNRMQQENLLLYSKNTYTLLGLPGQ